jgi:phosphoglycerate dehydrogenase-like enzyme
MTARILLPWPRLVNRCASDQVRIDVYDGGPEIPADLSTVDFYVLPYAKGDAPMALLRHMSSLRAVQTLSSGVERLAPLVPPDVVLCNGRGLHDASVAEHALSLILAAQRDLPRWVRQQDAGKWASHATRSLADSRVVIVGYGSIGRALERRLVGCEATVIRVASFARPAEQVYAPGKLLDLLPDADIVVLILPESIDTVGLFGTRELAALPDGALVVNVGRGKTLETDALLAEVAAGRLRAALDVVDPEPLPTDNPLWTMRGVFITPHVAGGSASFYPRAERFIVEQVRRFANGEPLRNVIPR